MQLKIYVPKHPLIEHLANLIQSADIPLMLIKNSAIELTYWLCYEAMRNWISLHDLDLRSLDGSSVTRLVNPNESLLAIPFVKSGLLMSESVNKLSPNIHFFYVSFKYRKSSCDVSDEDKLLLDDVNNYSKYLILDSIVLSADRILALLSVLAAKGVDLSEIRIAFLICTSDVLQDIGRIYPSLTIYTSCVKNIRGESELAPYRKLLEYLQT
nr:hypothetical protein [Erythrotrichia welwitschii]